MKRYRVESRHQDSGWEYHDGMDDDNLRPMVAWAEALSRNHLYGMTRVVDPIGVLIEFSAGHRPFRQERIDMLVATIMMGRRSISASDDIPQERPSANPSPPPRAAMPQYAVPDMDVNLKPLKVEEPVRNLRKVTIRKNPEK